MVIRHDRARSSPERVDCVIPWIGSKKVQSRIKTQVVE